MTPRQAFTCGAKHGRYDDMSPEPGDLDVCTQCIGWAQRVEDQGNGPAQAPGSSAERRSRPSRALGTCQLAARPKATKRGPS